MTKTTRPRRNTDPGLIVDDIITVGSRLKAHLTAHGIVVGEVTALHRGRAVTIQTEGGRTITDTIRAVEDEPLTLDEQIAWLARDWRTMPPDRLVHRLTSVLSQLMLDALDRYYIAGVPHPQGTLAWIRERIDDLTGPLALGDVYVAALLAVCPMCDGPGPWFRCPICSLGICATCQVRHDADRTRRGEHAICLQTARTAELHATMREHFLHGTDDPVLPEQEDFAYARRAMASSKPRR